MAGFAAFWALVAWWTANPILLPSPWSVIGAAIDLARELEQLEHAGISLGRMVVSIGIASALAIPLGLAMGLNRRFERFVEILAALPTLVHAVDELDGVRVAGRLGLGGDRPVLLPAEAPIDHGRGDVADPAADELRPFLDQDDRGEHRAAHLRRDHAGGLGDLDTAIRVGRIRHFEWQGPGHVGQ